MAINSICFAENYDLVKDAMLDYMAHYMAEHGRKGYTYDNSKTFAEKDKNMNALIRSEISKRFGMSLDGDALISNQHIASNPQFRWIAMSIEDTLIDWVMPRILYEDLGVFTETHTIEYGGHFIARVKPNDLFYVSKVSNDKRTTEYQRQYDSEVSIIPEARAVTTFVNWYRVVCGLDNLAEYVMKAALSLEAQIRKDIFGAFDAAMDEIPTTPADSALNLTGWSQDAAVRVAETVSAYNNAPAVFMGTKLALSKILPANTNFRFTLTDDYVRTGYIPDFMGYSAIELRQVADWKKPYTLALNDKKIYVVSPASQKLVHLVIEGGAHSIDRNFEDNADLTSSNTLFKRYGLGVATNAIAGVINLQ